MGLGSNRGLWGCSMVCKGKNTASCPEIPLFPPVKCALCTNTPSPPETSCQGCLPHPEARPSAGKGAVLCNGTTARLSATCVVSR